VFLLFVLNSDFDTGMRKGFITLSPEQTKIFYWCLIGLLYSIAGMAMYSLLVGNKKDKKIILETEQFIAPATSFKAFKQDTFSIPYSSVKDIKLQSAYNQHFAHITFDGGKVTIPASMVASLEIFEEIINTISERASDNQA